MAEKIILISRTKDKGGYQARLFGKNPPVQSFANTEIKALEQLVEKLKSFSPKFIQSTTSKE